MDLWAALLATAVLAFAATASIAAGTDPNLEACIAYAEVDAASNPALEKPRASKEEAEDAFTTACVVAPPAGMCTTIGVRPPRPSAPVALHEAYAVWEEAAAAFDAARKEVQAALNAPYYSIYKDDGGVLSNVESIMVKLLNADRERCRILYGI